MQFLDQVNFKGSYAISSDDWIKTKEHQNYTSIQYSKSDKRALTRASRDFDNASNALFLVTLKMQDILCFSCLWWMHICSVWSAFDDYNLYLFIYLKLSWQASDCLSLIITSSLCSPCFNNLDKQVIVCLW